MILADANFSTLFPDFLTGVQALSSTLVPVAAVLCFAGLTFATLRFMEGDKMTLYKKFVQVAVIAIAIGSIGDWSQQIIDAVTDLVTNTLHSDPSDVSNRFQAILAANSTASGNTAGGALSLARQPRWRTAWQAC